MKLLNSNTRKLKVGDVFYYPKDSKRYIVVKRSLGYVIYCNMSDLKEAYKANRFPSKKIHLVK